MTPLEREQPGSGPGSHRVRAWPPVNTAADVLEARKAAIGDGTEVRRLLPQRTLRTVGAWCFLDHYGPDDVSTGPGMQVPPHPHIGLQTVSWLFEGLVLHRDSLGGRQPIRPGELNLMTAGQGIAHSEESAAGRPAALHGLQLWIALPEQDRFIEPRFAHHADLPVVREGGARVTVVIGEHRGEQSPAELFTPLAGLEVAVPGGDDFVLPVREDFEYAVVAVDGSAVVAGALIAPGLMAHLPVGLSEIRLSHRRAQARTVLRARRRAVRRTAADVVELRGAQRRGDRARPRGLGSRAVRGRPRLSRRAAGCAAAAVGPAQAPLTRRRPARRAVADGKQHGPFGRKDYLLLPDRSLGHRHQPRRIGGPTRSSGRAGRRRPGHGAAAASR